VEGCRIWRTYIPVAKQERSLRFNNLLHHITLMLLERAYNRLNRKSAKGIDNESWTSFGERLPERIQNLHQRIHTQQYKPQPVLRIWLPKPNGEKRPIGLTAVEDKVVQQALVAHVRICAGGVVSEIEIVREPTLYGDLVNS
jgi:retron-type reverse transcriptase